MRATNEYAVKAMLLIHQQNRTPADFTGSAASTSCSARRMSAPSCCGSRPLQYLELCWKRLDRTNWRARFCVPIERHGVAARRLGGICSQPCRAHLTDSMTLADLPVQISLLVRDSADIVREHYFPLALLQKADIDSLCRSSRVGAR